MRYGWPAFLGLVYAGTAALLYETLPVVPDRVVRTPSRLAVERCLPGGRFVVLIDPSFAPETPTYLLDALNGRRWRVPSDLNDGIWWTTAGSEFAICCHHRRRELAALRLSDGADWHRVACGAWPMHVCTSEGDASVVAFDRRAKGWLHWDVAGRRVTPLPFLPDDTDRVFRSRDGRWLYAEQWRHRRIFDAATRLWDLRTGKTVRWGPVPVGEVSGFVYQADGSPRLAVHLTSNTRSKSSTLATEMNALLDPATGRTAARHDRAPRWRVGRADLYSSTTGRLSIRHDEPAGRLETWDGESLPFQLPSLRGEAPVVARYTERPRSDYGVSDRSDTLTFRHEERWPHLSLVARLRRLLRLDPSRGPNQASRFYWHDARRGTTSPPLAGRAVIELPGGRVALATSDGDAEMPVGDHFEVYSLPLRRSWVQPLLWAWLPTGVLWLLGLLFRRRAGAQPHRPVSMT